MKQVKKYTKTSTFIFPFLNIPKSCFLYDVKGFSKTETHSRFLNAYIYSEINEEHNNHVSIVCNSYQDLKFDEFYSNMTSNPYFVDCYEIDDLIVLIYEIPTERKEDYNKIVNGKYSQVSAEGKSLITKHHYFDSSSSVIPMILNKSQKLKSSWENKIGASLHDYEVWAIMNKESETLTFDILKEYAPKKSLKSLKEFE